MINILFFSAIFSNNSKINSVSLFSNNSNKFYKKYHVCTWCTHSIYTL